MVECSVMGFGTQTICSDAGLNISLIGVSLILGGILLIWIATQQKDGGFSG